MSESCSLPHDLVKLLQSIYQSLEVLVWQYVST